MEGISSTKTPRPRLAKGKHPLTQAELRDLCKQVGYAMGQGVYDHLVAYVEKNYREFDTTRNCQWDKVKFLLSTDWFDATFPNENKRERIHYYIRDLIISCIVHAGKIAGQCKRKTIQEADVYHTLAFLDDTY